MFGRLRPRGHGALDENGGDNLSCGLLKDKLPEKLRKHSTQRPTASADFVSAVTGGGFRCRDLCVQVNLLAGQH